MPDEGIEDGRRLEPAAVDAALAVVPGVVSSSVATDGSGVPVAVRIVLERGADPVEVAAAAQRILRLQFGVGLAPSHVQVVEESWPEPEPAPQGLHVVDDVPRPSELAAGRSPAPAGADDDHGRYEPGVLASAVRHPAGAGVPATAAPGATSADEPLVDISVVARPNRLAIAHLALADDGRTASAVVTLLRGRTEHVGMAEGGSDPDAVRLTIARATANAVSDALGPEVGLEVQVASLAPVAALEVVVVQVVWTTPEGDDRLLGATEVRDDVRQAVIRATLDAVNRRLALALDRR